MPQRRAPSRAARGGLDLHADLAPPRDAAAEDQQAGAVRRRPDADVGAVQQRPPDPRVVELGRAELDPGPTRRRRRDQDGVQHARLGADAVSEGREEARTERCGDGVVRDLGGHPGRVDVRGDDVPGGATDDDCPRPEGRGQRKDLSAPQTSHARPGPLRRGRPREFVEEPRQVATGNDHGAGTTGRCGFVVTAP